ncbi:MAG: hypothetical protein ACI97B_001582 [Verrucomicrobiales bacterium]
MKHREGRTGKAGRGASCKAVFFFERFIPQGTQTKC